LKSKDHNTKVKEDIELNRRRSTSNS